MRRYDRKRLCEECEECGERVHSLLPSGLCVVCNHEALNGGETDE